MMRAAGAPAPPPAPRPAGTPPWHSPSASADATVYNPLSSSRPALPPPSAGPRLSPRAGARASPRPAHPAAYSPLSGGGGPLAAGRPAAAQAAAYLTEPLAASLSGLAARGSPLAERRAAVTPFGGDERMRPLSARSSASGASSSSSGDSAAGDGCAAARGRSNAVTPSPAAGVTDATWRLLRADDGSVRDLPVLLRAVHAGGVAPHLRPAVWPLLLGALGPGDGDAQQHAVAAAAEREFARLCAVAGDPLHASAAMRRRVASHGSSAAPHAA